VEIDVKTVQVVCALLAMSSAGAIVFIRHQYRGLHGLAGWAAGLALIAGGWIIPALPVEAGSIFGAPNIFLAGILAIWLGVRRFNFPTIDLRRLGLMLAALLAVSLTLRFAEAFTLANDFADSVGGLVSLLAARDVLRQGPRERLAVRFPVAIGLVLTGLALPGKAVFGPIDMLMLIAGLVVVAISLPLMALERRQRVDARLATIDELTGLPNRRSFLESARRLGRQALLGHRPVAVLMMDLDLFSGINERFGHGGGDLALAAFADHLRENLRPGDVIGRLGGEEFCACLPDTSREDAWQIADRLRRHVAESVIELEGERIVLSVSIGIATLEANDVTAAIAAADRALYAAKAAGRNRLYGAGLSPAGRLLHTARAA
jgi:diguanylate cyclase (GGDEF)-like protein